MRTMTVAQVVAMLQAMDPTLEVHVTIYSLLPDFQLGYAISLAVHGAQAMQEVSKAFR